MLFFYVFFVVVFCGDILHIQTTQSVSEVISRTSNTRAVLYLQASHTRDILDIGR